jgi:hypothetical protein
MHVVIDERLLSDDELDEYRRINKLSFSENDIVRLVILGLIYPALTVFLVVQSQQLKGDPSDLDGLFSLLAAVVLFTGWIGPFGAWKRGSENAKKTRDERRWKFRRSLRGYDNRRLRPAVPDDEPGSTRRRTQHLWYDGRDELDWQDRTRAEMLGGMDVDTYINNVAEHDKD